jgi:hypothetical protein
MFSYLQFFIGDSHSVSCVMFIPIVIWFCESKSLDWHKMWNLNILVEFVRVFWDRWSIFCLLLFILFRYLFYFLGDFILKLSLKKEKTRNEAIYSSWMKWRMKHKAEKNKEIYFFQLFISPLFFLFSLWTRSCSVAKKWEPTKK